MTPLKGAITTQESIRRNQVLEVIDKLQKGYLDRDIDGVDLFIEEVFTREPDMTILGTSTDEFCIEVDGIKELLVGDWEGWGDVALNRDSLQLINNDDYICFFTQGTVNYSFEHSKERDIRYVDYLKGIIEDNSMSNAQRIAFANWVLSLNYHNREDNPRDYYWSMTLCGIMDGSNDQLLISNLMFSIVPSVYPDERFENNKEYQEEYQEQLETVNAHIDGADNKEMFKALSQVFGAMEETYNGIFHGPNGQKTSVINDLVVEPSSIVAKRFKDLSWLTFFGLHEFHESTEDGETR